MIPWHLTPVPLVAGVVLLAAWRWRARSWPSAVALAASFATGYAAVLESIAWNPASAQGWLPHLGVMAAGAAVLARGPLAAHVLLRLAVGAATAWILLRKGATAQWDSTVAAIAAHAGVAIAVAGFWTVYAIRSEATRGYVLPGLFTLSAGGMSMVMLGAGSASNAELAAALSMGLGAIAAFAAWKREVVFAPAGVGVAVTLLVALAASGHFFLEDFPLVAAALLLLAPLPALLPMRRPWLAFGAAIVVVGLTVAMWGPRTTPADASGGCGSEYDPYAHGYD